MPSKENKGLYGRATRPLMRIKVLMSLLPALSHHLQSYKIYRAMKSDVFGKPTIGARLLFFVLLLASSIVVMGCNRSEVSTSAANKTPPDGPAPAVVTGTVTGPGGTVPETAHVSVYAQSSKKLRSAQVNTEGRFAMAVDTAGVAELTFSAPHLSRASALTYLTRGDTAALDVRLAALTRDTSEAAEAVGTFNDFDSRSGAVPLQKQGRGNYAATLPAPGDSVAYQIVGVRSGWPPISGTQADRRVYQDREGYRSVVAAPGDSVRVAFDPSQLPGGEGRQQVAFEDSTSEAARYYRFAEVLQRRDEAYMETLRSDKGRADTIDWSAHHGRVRAALKRDLPDRLRNAYLAAYLEFTQDTDPSLARRAMNQIPTDAPEWALGGFLALPYQAAAAAGDLETYRPFLYEVLRTHPDSSIRAGVLFQMLARADREGNTGRQRLLYSWITGEHPNSRYTDIAQSRHDPNRRVQVGKSVPDFEVGALQEEQTQEEQTFTPSDFEGRYLLIDFWATWCGPCIEEFPNLRSAYRRYDRDDFAILSVSLDAKRENVTGFLKERKLPWQHAFAEGTFESPIAEQFQVTGLPKPVLIGPDGRIEAVGTDLRGERLFETLKRKIEAS